MNRNQSHYKTAVLGTLLVGSLVLGGPLSASSIKTCRLQARVLKVFPAGPEKPRYGVLKRKVKIHVEKARFSGGHSMGRRCSFKGLKLDVDLRIKPEHTTALRVGARITVRHRTVINQRRMDGRWRFVRFTSYTYIPPRNNNLPVPPRPGN